MSNYNTVILKYFLLLSMAFEQLKGFFLALLRMLSGHSGGVPLVFKLYDLFPALVKVYIEEYHLLSELTQIKN